MKTWLKWPRIGIATLLLAFVVPALADAAPPAPPAPPASVDAPDAPPGPGGPPAVEEWWSNPEVAQKLNLTAEQKKRIDDLMYQSGQRMVDLRATMHKSRMALNHLLGGETLDRSAVDKAADEVVAAECALMRERTMLRVSLAQVLDREQRLALREVVRERMGGPREGRGGRGPRQRGQ